jgi:short-subunit dehydrogenase involved in D-alanine esterification of teichoic acids
LIGWFETMNPDPLFDFTGKTILITGGSRGFGYHMVKAFAERGADLIVARRTIKNCDAVASEVRALASPASSYTTGALARVDRGQR